MPQTAPTRELMERMGHSISRAALICLHSTSARRRARVGDLAFLSGGLLAVTHGR
jgi:hypothetical protein